MNYNLIRDYEAFNAIELDSTKNKWLLAASIDRELMSRNKPQIYGTQYTKMREDQPLQGNYYYPDPKIVNSNLTV